MGMLTVRVRDDNNIQQHWIMGIFICTAVQVRINDRAWWECLHCMMGIIALHDGNAYAPLHDGNIYRALHDGNVYTAWWECLHGVVPVLWDFRRPDGIDIVLAIGPRPRRPAIRLVTSGELQSSTSSPAAKARLSLAEPDTCTAHAARPTKRKQTNTSNASPHTCSYGINSHTYNDN
jgi:hypothetical protein